MKQRNPVVGYASTDKKVPPLAQLRSRGHPRWLLSKIDMDGCPENQGLYGWHVPDRDAVRELVVKLQSVELTSWPDLEKGGSHFLTYEKLSKSAKARIEAKRVRDTDRIYSLRLAGQYRVIGLRYEDDFFVIWHDPEHAFCPSVKKS